MKSASIHHHQGAQIAYHHTPGTPPTVVFCPGYASHMGGTKALHLEQWCQARGNAYLRFDYQGHGESSGRFEDGTISLWAGDAQAVIEATTEGPLVLVGSSMGGWTMLLAALALRPRTAALVGLAAAPDFTRDWPANLTAEQQGALAQHGVVYVPSDYGEEPTPIAQCLIDDGNEHLLLDSAIDLDCPVRLIQGLEDPDVPWQTALTLADRLTSTDVQVILIKGGVHRLSSPAELTLLTDTLAPLL